MAEISSVESWILRLQESDRIFYQQINEIRAKMGMPPAKPPSYDNKKQDPEPVILHPEASGSRLQSMEENLKMDLSTGKPEGTKEIEDPERLQKPIFSCQKEVEDSVTKEIADREQSQEDEQSQDCKNEDSVVSPLYDFTLRIGSDVSDESNQESMVGSLTSRIDFGGDNSHDTRLKITNSSLVEKDTSLAISGQMARNRPSVPSPHEVGSTLGANSEGQNCWGDLIKSHGEVTLDPLEMDMLKLVDNWKDSIDVRLSDFQLNSVIFLVKFSAPKVFVKMSKKEWNDVAESVKLLSTLGHFFYSVDSSRSFVFDPGKSNKFLLHNGSVEALVTLVFDPGGDQVVEVCAEKIPFWDFLAKLVLEMEKCREPVECDFYEPRMAFSSCHVEDIVSLASSRPDVMLIIRNLF